MIKDMLIDNLKHIKFISGQFVSLVWLAHPLTNPML
jgi:hypothetical protein